METAHFPDTWGGQKEPPPHTPTPPPEPGGEEAEEEEEKRERRTTHPGSPLFLCAHLENGTARLSEGN